MASSQAGKYKEQTIRQFPLCFKPVCTYVFINIILMLVVTVIIWMRRKFNLLLLHCHSATMTFLLYPHYHTLRANPLVFLFVHPSVASLSYYYICLNYVKCWFARLSGGNEYICSYSGEMHRQSKNLLVSLAYLFT